MMRQKGGDSNKKFQRTFFTPPKQTKGLDNPLASIEKKNDAWLKKQPQPQLQLTTPSAEELALNVAVLFSLVSK